MLPYESAAQCESLTCQFVSLFVNLSILSVCLLHMSLSTVLTSVNISWDFCSRFLSFFQREYAAVPGILSSPAPSTFVVKPFFDFILYVLVKHGFSLSFCPKIVLHRFLSIETHRCYFGFGAGSLLDSSLNSFWLEFRRVSGNLKFSSRFAYADVILASGGDFVSFCCPHEFRRCLSTPGPL